MGCSDQPCVSVPCPCVSSHGYCMLEAGDSAANQPMVIGFSLMGNLVHSASDSWPDSSLALSAGKHKGFMIKHPLVESALGLGLLLMRGIGLLGTQEM